MTRNIRTLVVAAALAVTGVVATADQAAAQYPYYSGYTPYGGTYGYTQSYSTGYASPFVPGGYYSSGYQTGFYSPPVVGFYPTPPSNIWTGSYYVSPATYWRMRGRW